MIEFRPAEDEVGTRVDGVLAKRAGVARSVARRALDAGDVTVDGTNVRPSHRLGEGELVSGEVIDARAGAPEPEDIPLDVRFSDDRVLVVSKPAGLVSHPAGGHRTGTLVNALLALGEPLGKLYPERPGLVHRLDRETSGLLLVAKDDEAQAFLMDALKNREIERRYLALVKGVPATPSGTIDAPVGRHPSRPQLMAVRPEGRLAVTHYEVRDASADAALLEVRLETGRTHQIRVHLAHIDHPVVGDRIYGGAGDLAKRLGLERPFLHAVKLAFPHPDGGRIELEDPLPEELNSALQPAGISSIDSSSR